MVIIELITALLLMHLASQLASSASVSPQPHLAMSSLCRRRLQNSLHTIPPIKDRDRGPSPRAGVDRITTSSWRKSSGRFKDMAQSPLADHDLLISGVALPPRARPRGAVTADHDSLRAETILRQDEELDPTDDRERTGGEADHDLFDGRSWSVLLRPIVVGSVPGAPSPDAAESLVYGGAGTLPVELPGTTPLIPLFLARSCGPNWMPQRTNNRTLLLVDGRLAGPTNRGTKVVSNLEEESDDDFDNVAEMSPGGGGSSWSGSRGGYATPYYGTRHHDDEVDLTEEDNTGEIGPELFPEVPCSRVARAPAPESLAIGMRGASVKEEREWDVR
ncbi:hypothetical protein V8F20_003969 [Naviculisporaceae sp. PSN 640]